MGSGSYSSTLDSVTNTVVYDSSIRDSRLKSTGMDYNTKSHSEIFSKRTLSHKMNPKGIMVRESKDSDEHPESLSIIIGLDTTGSMGQIPLYLVREGLPKTMGRIIQRGEQHPQVLFLGIGDHECDTAPLQVSQFESSDELLDKWLTDVYLEAGGGGNQGESYLLAWYFAAFHTHIDCFEKRQRKGFLFTIGDEKTLKTLPSKVIESLMGPGQYSDYSAMELLGKAREKYNVYHIHVCETGQGHKQENKDDWKQIMGDNLILAEKHQDISTIIADIITSKSEQATLTEKQETKDDVDKETEKVDKPKKQKISL